MNQDICITNFFAEELRAPLHMPRQSWGAYIDGEDAVILRAWDDQSKYWFSGKLHWKILDMMHDRTNEAGYNERVNQIEAIRQGAQCFIVRIFAIDPETNTRKIRKFTKGYLWIGGALLQHEGNWYIEIIDSIPLHEFKKRKPGRPWHLEPS